MYLIASYCRFYWAASVNLLVSVRDSSTLSACESTPDQKILHLLSEVPRYYRSQIQGLPDTPQYDSVVNFLLVSGEPKIGPHDAGGR